MSKFLKNITLSLIVGIGTLILGFLIIDLVIYGKARASHEENWHDPNTQFDSELGWSPIPNREIEHKWGKISSNLLGFRSGPLDPKKKKIILLGDSVIWGYGLGDERIAATILEGKLSGTDLQVVNMGVSGYGLDQYYLFLKRHIMSLKPVSKVILIIQTGFDLGETRMSNTYGKRKPLFVMEKGELKLRFVPISKYCLRNLYSMSYLLNKMIAKWPGLSKYLFRLAGDHVIMSGNEILNVSGHLLANIHDLAISSGGSFHIVLSPSFREFSELSTEHHYFQEVCRTKDYDCLDFLDVLRKENTHPRALFMDPNHYNEQGNVLLAETLHDRFIAKA